MIDRRAERVAAPRTDGAHSSPNVPAAPSDTRRELSGRADVDLLVRTFYRRALVHPDLEDAFEVLRITGLDEHLVVIGDFWEQVLFRTGRYRGDFLGVHRALDGKYGLTPHRFEVWLRLWTETVDALFVGVDAERAKSKAVAMAAALQRRLARRP